MLPTLFSLGPISFSSFGFFAAAAFLLACFLIWKFSHEELLFSKMPIKDETLFDAVFIFTLGIIFGARLIFIFSHFQNFGFNFLSWILVRQASGFSFLGGFIVGCAFLFIFSLKKKLDFWKMADLFSLGITAALSLCFIGAFLDGVGAGAKTTLAWGVLFVGLEGKRHPVQLMAAVFFLIFFLILKRTRLLVLKRRKKKGIIVFGFLSLSGLALFLLDFLKEGRIYLSGLKKDQLLYLIATILSGACLYKRLERNFKSDFQAFYQCLKSVKKVKLNLKKRGKK